MSTPSVCFPAGETGSSLLMGALAEASARHADVFAGVAIPSDPKRFKAGLPDLLTRFEARRAACDARADIARALHAHVARRARFGDRPLDEAVLTGDPGDAITQVGSAKAGWVPEITYRGRTWSGRAIAELAHRLRADHQLTAAAERALVWVADTLLGGPVVLSDQRFVLMGAGAELAPTSYLLAAGARVLWVDRAAPALDPARFAGTLVHHPGALDLLGQTPAVGAAVARELDGGPSHLGLFAYAPGGGRELLLTAAMNAIAAQVRPASVSMWVSPTTPGEVPPEDQADRSRRRRSAPRWQRALARARVLPEAFEAYGDVQIARSIVPLQGPTYLAAQYLGKMMAGEAWAVDRAPMRVSANVAGITHTRSLEHPLFLAGFRGATSFGIEVFQPDQTRVLATLLMLHDLLNPDAPAADPAIGPSLRALRVGERAIHGGVRSVPFGLDASIRVAAVIGLGKQPSLLLKLRG